MKLIIQNNRIAATATDDYTGPDEYVPAPADFDAARMGEYVYADGALTLPAPAVCSPAQGLVALYVTKGITESDITAAIAEIPDDAARYTAQIGYTRATEWRRDSATMHGLAALLGLSDADCDALYALAVQVQV